jgi:Zn-dependent peptidase ImmA (M78 family)
VSEQVIRTRQVSDPRADQLRDRYFAAYPGGPVPVPVESIAEDLLGLSIERSWDINYSGILLPHERTIVLNAREDQRNLAPLRRYRFTIAHEVGHWICHCLGGVPQPIYCRTVHPNPDEGVGREREADRFAATLLMPEQAVREAWAPTAAELAPTLERLAQRSTDTRLQREELRELVHHKHDRATRRIAAMLDVSPSAMLWRLVNLGLRPAPPRAPR